MKAPTWTMRCARLLLEQLIEIAEAARCERWAMRMDGGIGIAAIAAISGLPRGPRRDLELAVWARRIAESDRISIAFPVGQHMSEDEVAAIAELHGRVWTEIGGAP